MAGTPEHISAVLDSDLLDRIVNLTSSTNIELRKEAIWCICNGFTTGNSYCSEKLLKRTPNLMRILI